MLNRILRLLDLFVVILVFLFSAKSDAPKFNSDTDRTRTFTRQIEFDYPNWVLNAAWIKTTIDLGGDAVGQSTERPLMGQSPYVVNAGLYYTDNDRGLQCNVLYNVIGPRLFAVGTFGSPDIYEVPRNVIDVTATKNLGKRFELKLSVQDLLNQRVRLVQDSDESGKLDQADEEVMSFRRGQYVSAGIAYRF